MDKHILQKIITQQRNEITEHHIYRRLAVLEKNDHNKKVLLHIAGDEMKHYGILRTYTEKDVAPRMWFVTYYTWIARIFGLTFGLKLMEGGEQGAQDAYKEFLPHVPEVKEIIADESDHEAKLLDTLNEEKLTYVGSIVLGLNDALVELLGVLAGLTLAFQKSELIVVAGAITGIAASFSMGASEYLSTKNEQTNRSALKSAIYTGGAYFITVVILVTPYLILENYFLSLGIAVVSAIVIIAVFNFYVATAKGESFRKRFLEMVTISLGVAFFSFLLGAAVKHFLGIDV